MRELSRSPTVRDAWTDYVATRATPPEARDLAIWRRFIEPSLGSRAVASLTTGELERWLAARLAEHGQRRPNRSCTAGEEREARRRAHCTANRRFNLLRAILNSAYRKDPQRVKSADAWRRVRAFQRADRPRTRVLNVGQCQRLLDVLPMPLRAPARGALYSGCRLGELLARTTRVAMCSTSNAGCGEPLGHVRAWLGGASRELTHAARSVRTGPGTMGIKWARPASAQVTT